MVLDPTPRLEVSLSGESFCRQLEREKDAKKK